MRTMTNDIFSNRRANLRDLIDQWHGPLALSKKLGYSNASFVVQMAGPNPNREVTEKTARKIEQTLGLPPGWMDEPAGRKGLAGKVDTSLVAVAIRAVMQTAEEEGVKLSPTKLGDIVALVYADAESNNEVIRADYIRNIIKIIK